MRSAVFFFFFLLWNKEGVNCVERLLKWNAATMWLCFLVLVMVSFLCLSENPLEFFLVFHLKRNFG